LVGFSSSRSRFLSSENVAPVVRRKWDGEFHFKRASGREKDAFPSERASESFLCERERARVRFMCVCAHLCELSVCLVASFHSQPLSPTMVPGERSECQLKKTLVPLLLLSLTR